MRYFAADGEVHWLSRLDFRLAHHIAKIALPCASHWGANIGATLIVQLLSFDVAVSACSYSVTDVVSGDRTLHSTRDG